jgi:nicotinate-nucleotide adenylyltransferase
LIAAARNGLKRIGLLGGSFDPIHVGHLHVARHARLRLGLDRVVFMPAGQPPHKLGQAMTDPEDRFEMVRLAVAGEPHFSVSRIDLDRPGPSYSVDTVRLLQEAWGPDARIYFLIGADSLADFPTWYRPRRLLELCQVVAVGRPGYAVDLAALARRFSGAPPVLFLEHVPQVDISATEVRRRVAEGHSIQGLVPPAVATYIEAHGLYRPSC